MDAAQRPTTWSILTPLLLGVLLATALQLLQPVLWPMWWYGAMLAVAALMGVIAVVAWRWQRLWATRSRSVGVVVVMITTSTVFALCGLRASGFAAHALSPSVQGRDVRVQGMIVAMPHRSDVGVRFRFAPTQATLQGRPVAVPPLWELTWYAHDWQEQQEPQDAPDALPAAHTTAPRLRAGQRWELTVRLKAPHGARNPYGFDYELWLWEQGVQATGYVRSSPRDTPPRLLEQTVHHPIEQLRQHVRDAIMQRLSWKPTFTLDTDASDAAQRLHASRAAGVVAALVTGDQRAIDRSDWDVFRATGVAHLMSISGLHITLFASITRLLVGWLWRRSGRLCLWWPAPRVALLGGLLLATGYALFSGWGIPAQRTMLMLATVVLLRLWGLRWPWPIVWLLACAVVVVCDPYAILQAGFWLSFIAVGILFASTTPHNVDNVDNVDKAQVAATGAGVGWGRAFVGYIQKFVREQWVLTVALTPLTVLFFGQISLVGMLANALAIPWVTLVTTPLALLGVGWPVLWDVAAASVTPLVLWLQWLAAWPAAVYTLAAAPLWAALGALVGGVCLVLHWPWQWRMLGTVFLLPVLLWEPERPAQGHFSVLAADVGQGSAVLVQTARHALLYDAGPRYGPHNSNAGERVLIPLMRALGVRLDRLVLSHSDTDHTGGALAVAAVQPQVQWIGGGWGVTSWPLGMPAMAPCQAGQRWHWDGVDFEVLHPTASTATHSARHAPTGQSRRISSNAWSCVLRITSAQGVSALLVGDIERAQEAALLARGVPLKAQVLLVPHHGSSTSSSAAFVQAVSPQYALVQAGWRNRFGHPAPAVVQRWHAVGATVVDSPSCGAAQWYSERAAQVRCERTASVHYWQYTPP